ncbi:MAG TPA: hypothetical protein VK507_24865 [Iamia sp.]|nr:hypothetical protein [Iamia sp.]
MPTPIRRRRCALAVLALTALLLGACGGGADESASGSDASASGRADETTTTDAPETTIEAPPPTTAAPATPSTEAATTSRYSFEDAFETADDGWVTGCNDIGCAGVEDSIFYEDIKPGEKEIDQHAEWEGRVLYDVTVEAGIVLFGAGNPEGGVVCHADPDAGTYYDFTVGADGQASLYRFDGAGGEALAGPFAIDGFVAESTIITGRCAYETDGSLRLTMQVNGEQVADAVDPDPLAPGEVGLITYGDSGELSTVHYEYVSTTASELV